MHIIITDLATFFFPSPKIKVRLFPGSRFLVKKRFQTYEQLCSANDGLSHNRHRCVCYRCSPLPRKRVFGARRPRYCPIAFLMCGVAVRLRNVGGFTSDQRCAVQSLNPVQIVPCVKRLEMHFIVYNMDVVTSRRTRRMLWDTRR